MIKQDAITLLSAGPKGVEEWNKIHQHRYQKSDNGQTKERFDLSGIDLSGFDLTGIDLTGVDLSSANLADAILTNSFMPSVKLTEAFLVRARLFDAVMAHSCLTSADLTESKLMGANLIQADLTGANLTNAELGGANLMWANFTNTIFTGAGISGNIFSSDLSSCIGLESVFNRSRCDLTIEAILQSKGRIPVEFLQNCGIPDSLIEYIPSLIGTQEAIQFYSCFISYSHKDEAFSRRLHSRMRDEHLRVWYAPEDMKSGKKIHEQIDQAIRVHDKLLLVISEESMASDWVNTEIYSARQREKKEGRQVLFPIRLVPFEKIQDWKCFDADTGRDMAREVREYFIPDFSHWKDHEEFEKGFQKLLDSLRNAGVEEHPTNR